VPNRNILVAFVLKTIGEYRGSPRPVKDGLARVCVFLTATIDPPQAAVTRNDPQMRLQDYLASLDFYLSMPTAVVDRLLFVDNSGSDLTPIERFVRPRAADKVIELISFAGNDHALSHGKAYGEFKLLDFGIEHTSLLTEDDHFWKVTGRLKVLNLADVIAAITTKYDVLCDLHNFPFVGTGKVFDNHWMDLRLFSCTQSAYKKLFAGRYEELGPRINQDVLYDVVMEARGQLKILPRFLEQPVISGVSGRHNRGYDEGLQKMKTVVRTGIRRAVPFLWI
jgi:hypothetical protein